KPGAARKADDRFFGMAIQPAADRVLITELGLLAPGAAKSRTPANSGKYRLTVMRAADRSVIASVDLDLTQGAPDRFGFKYARLPKPVQLDAAPGQPVVIHPRGLERGGDYDVRCAKA